MTSAEADPSAPDGIPLHSDAIEEFEDRLDEALRSGTTEGLDIVGYGEVSVAVRLSAAAGEFVCKRLVPFSSVGAAQESEALVHRYVQELGRSGIDVVPTATLILHRPVGHVLYCVQRMLPAGTLGPDFLRGKTADEAAPHVRRIFEKIDACVSPELAPDGQLSNWAFDGERLLYLDVGTPFMRDSDGRDLFDFRAQTRAIPQPIRSIVNRFMLQGILDNYHSKRGQALDFLGNLIKEGLGDLLVPMIPIANQVFSASPEITEPEVRAHYKSDAQSYALIQFVRRADHWVHRRLLRKAYPYLLPPRIERFG